MCFIIYKISMINYLIYCNQISTYFRSPLLNLLIIHLKCIIVNEISWECYYNILRIVILTFLSPKGEDFANLLNLTFKIFCHGSHEQVQQTFWSFQGFSSLDSFMQKIIIFYL